MIAAISSVWALLLGLAIMMLGTGLQGTLLGLRGTNEGFDVATIGIVMSANYLGLIAGSMVAPALVRRVGHIRVFAALASLYSAAALLHAMLVFPLAWFAMRLLTGFAIAGLYVIVESWLNHASTVETRGKVLSVYTIIAVGFMAMGQFLLNVADPGGAELFIIVSVLVSLSLIPISLTPHAAPPIDQPGHVSIVELYRASPLGVIGCLATGVAQGAFFSLAAVYATLVGLDVSTTALFLALPLGCVVLSQFPIGALSDRYDRRLVLTALALAVAALSLVNIVTSFGAVIWQLSAVMLLGGLMIPLYALSIAHMNDHIEYGQMLGASARLLLVYGIGSAVGPLLAGGIMNATGPQGFFWFLGAVHMALGLFAVYRMARSRPVPVQDQGEFVMVQPRATAIATAVAMELGEDGAAAMAIEPSEIP